MQRVSLKSFAVIFLNNYYLTELLPDQPDIEEDDPIASEIIIPGLPFLSKNLAVGRGARPSQTGRVERDLALYDRKSQDFYEKIVEEARLGEKAELKSPDPLVFWLAQVCYPSIPYVCF